MLCSVSNVGCRVDPWLPVLLHIVYYLDLGLIGFQLYNERVAQVVWNSSLFPNFTNKDYVVCCLTNIVFYVILNELIQVFFTLKY